LFAAAPQTLLWFLCSLAIALGCYLISMKLPIFALSSLAMGTACARTPRTAAIPPCESPPLAPRLQFAEPIAPGDVALLVLDGHSGAPLRETVATFDSTSLVANGDSLGRIRFHRVAAGLLRLRIRRVNFVMYRDSITLRDGTGLALVVQMQPGPILEEVGRPPSRQPPNER
jgi:hypothetical protein